MPPLPAVLLDANVLHSNQQRNLILQLAAQGVVSVAWTAAIEGEWLRNTEPGIRERVRSHTLPLIRKHFPDALIETAGPPFAPIGRTDADDLHIAAAAVKLAPCRLVTWNVDDFDAGVLAERGVVVQTPDEFLCAVLDANPELIVEIMGQAQANLTRSAPTWEAYLDILEARNGLKGFVGRIRRLERLLRIDEEDTPTVKTKGPGEK
jgi:hypothetical protein